MNHCEAAHDLFMQTVRDMKIDVALLSKPYKHLTDWPWETDSTTKAIIWSCGKFCFQNVVNNSNAGFVAASLDGIHLYSCYAPPSLSLPDFVDFLDRLVEDAKRHHPVAIAGDFNAWAVDWGSRKTNARGKALLEAFNALDVVLLNSGDKPTFEKGSASSIIDLTFVSNSLVRGICNWEVLDIYTASDHNAIIWEISTNRNIKHAEEHTRELMERITETCDISMTREHGIDQRQSVHWWTEEISSLRKECLKKRRISQRGYSLSNSAQLVVEYKQARRQLNKAIKDSKVRCWKELLDEVEENPWGRPYKTVMSRLKSQPVPSPTCPRLLNKKVTTLFPRQPNLNYQVTHVEQNNIPLITLQELMEACHRVAVIASKINCRGTFVNRDTTSRLTNKELSGITESRRLLTSSKEFFVKKRDLTVTEESMLLRYLENFERDFI
ncbi:uncharacterized protein LOC113375676 [Ctenocephalides felis]|uniref:uncharacterized protein LOC113375676 n=1 Tax=Ctenocephalides felis TaxID=7515 RepID=UPI000E6E4418|nr:uncharacterized protein LOC113375676 [Ctenocephalides felis]